MYGVITEHKNKNTKICNTRKVRNKDMGEKTETNTKIGNEILKNSRDNVKPNIYVICASCCQEYSGARFVKKFPTNNQTEGERVLRKLSRNK